MKILKFGGSSVATADRIQSVVDIVRQARQEGSLAVVVSALGGVTDDLLKAAGQAADRDIAYNDLLGEIETRHLDVLNQVVVPTERSRERDEIAASFRDLHDLLHGTYLLREASARIRDSISSYGERLSARLVAAALRAADVPAELCDARALIVTGPQFGAARVDTDATYERVRRHFANEEQPLRVVTGFIGATPGGETTTLGRGGSDYTAALLGAALDVTDVELWSDVPGVMSADPRLVPEARPIQQLSYEELMELSHFGAKVVYPPSLQPIRSQGIRLWSRNTFDPSQPGTRVTAEAEIDDERPVRGIASIPDVAILRLQGAGMIGVPGTARRLFEALARENVSVILISQASSEHSICFVVASADVAAAIRGASEEFVLERQVGHVDPLVVEKNMAVVAAVGAGMRSRTGIAGRIFGVLGDHGINVHAISQGSSELNISFVVRAEHAARGVNVIHDAFLFPQRRTVEVCMVGVGRVGSALLRQLEKHGENLVSQKNVSVRLIAVVGRREALVDENGLDPGTALQRLRAEGEAYEIDSLADSILSHHRPYRVFVDCTASDEVTGCYQRLLEGGVSVVTANKLKVAGPRASWEALKAVRGPGRLYFETTVGAGLPVIGTLEYLLSTGDRVSRLEGVFSGTLGFLADELAGGRPFSEVVRDAHGRGFTEPDPREDLSGNDVARKLLILARTTGHDLEPDDVTVEGLLPDPSWQALSLDEFWDRLPELDAPFAARQAEAEAVDGRLCYLARLSDDGASVALGVIGKGHPCAGIRGTDNLIAIYTDRYRETPLVVQGPGAGPDVTAAGVFGDILKAVAEA